MEFRDALENINADEKFEAFISAEEDFEFQMNDARNEGIEQGEEKKTREMIFNLHALGTPIEVIAKASNMSEEEVQQLLDKKEN